MRETRHEKLQLLVLADLHLCAGETSSRLLKKFYPAGWSEETVGWARKNITKLLSFIAETRIDSPPDHVIVLGDLTNRGFREEFVAAKTVLLEFQDRLLVSRGEEEQRNGCLKSSLFTIIPGNHDLSVGTRTDLGCLIDIIFGVLASILYRILPSSVKDKRMRKLLSLFDDFFGETIEGQNMRPSRYPVTFGTYEKFIDNTNVRLVPMNSCVPLPVTASNACGSIDDSQLARLTGLNGSVGEVEPFRLVLMHHYPMAIPLHDNDNLRKRQDMNDSSHVVSRIYQPKTVAMILAGHRHADFIWSNSTSVPGVEFCMPVVAVRTAAHYMPGSSNMRFCILQLEGRDLSHCSFEQTHVSVDYYAWKPGGGCRKESSDGYGYWVDPRLYDNNIKQALYSVQNVRNKFMGKIESFIDFTGSNAVCYADMGIFEAHSGDDRTCIEASRWGIIIHGIMADPCKVLLHVAKAGQTQNSLGTKRVTLSLTHVRGTPEVLVELGTRPIWVSVGTVDVRCVAVVDEFDHNTPIGLKFRSQNGVGEVVINCVCISRI
jgi:3',5'-cyclic AMP phosphodiesterase CpdA